MKLDIDFTFFQVKWVPLKLTVIALYFFLHIFPRVSFKKKCLAPFCLSLFVHLYTYVWISHFNSMVETAMLPCPALLMPRCTLLSKALRFTSSLITLLAFPLLCKCACWWAVECESCDQAWKKSSTRLIWSLHCTLGNFLWGLSD